ncbi:MAG: hydantoinase/oxoprolinase family protein [Rhodospirillales bacterium]|nr:hydantoinase/oxoprolinase family protein [Rhodospirillales bacterium]
MRVGIEVGGTFTDLVSVDAGQIKVIKVPSTPQQPDVGAFNALQSANIDPASVSDLVHGSTVATNAILERRGASIAFVTTRGFRDILFMQRHDRSSVYDLHYKKPTPPVQRRDCFEVTERIGADGTIKRPLNETEVVRDLIPTLAAGGYQAIAICLLSAYIAPEHEIQLKALISKALPDVRVTTSHEVAPEFREYERAATTALSAYVQPVIDGYLNRFEGNLTRSGFKGHFSVMQSNGGRVPAAAMRNNSIAALLSGPAAGVVGAIRQAARSDRKNLITFDMGGTSTDVSLVQEGEAPLAAETHIDGLPIRTPVLDIVTVGAGGGSLIWIDEGGMLRVGPRSAGAEPGPACYGRGGTLPTVTDAHVVRGTIRPEAFLGGTMNLHIDKAYRAFEEVARQLGTTVESAAAAAIRLAVANIVRAIQLVSTERGRDPRDYSLLPFGGAGPLLAAEIADELGVAEILVPPNPGVISAMGLLSADYVKLRGITRRAKLDNDTPALIVADCARLMVAAEDEFKSLGLKPPFTFTLGLDMRFIGQAFEIPVAIDPAELQSITAEILSEKFVSAHRRVYLHGGEAGRQIELVGFRFGARRNLDELPIMYERSSGLKRPKTASVIVGGQAVNASVIEAAEITTDMVSSPALIEGYSSTTWVPPGWVAVRDNAGNMIMKKTGGK